MVGVDYSEVAVGAAQRRADELGVACRYVVGPVPGVPLADASADLVYTGKGALIWMPDLTAWAREVARLLRPAGHLFIYEAHPVVPCGRGTRTSRASERTGDYFGRSHVNDTFPARGAVEWQWTLGEIVTAAIARRHGAAAPRRIPGTLLAGFRCLGRGLGRATAELFQPARPSMLVKPSQLGLGYGLFGSSLGWGGWGGSIVMIEPDERMAVAYVANQMREPADDNRGLEIIMAAHEGLKALRA